MASKTIVVGLDELSTKLANVLASVDGAGLVAALTEGAEIVEKDAKRRVVRDSGRLGDSIEIRVLSKELQTASVGVGPGPIEKPINQREAFYQHFVEFGTSKQPARPFLRPALDENRKQVTEAVGAELKRRIERAAR